MLCRFSIKNLLCGLIGRGDSNQYHQHMFFIDK